LGATCSGNRGCAQESHTQGALWGGGREKCKRVVGGVAHTGRERRVEKLLLVGTKERKGAKLEGMNTKKTISLRKVGGG